MQTRLENGTLTLYPEGRIDSANAAAAEAEILAAAAEAGGADIAVDAERLQYISSAGLRVFLFAQKIRLIRDDHLSRSPLRGCARLE